MSSRLLDDFNRFLSKRKIFCICGKKAKGNAKNGYDYCCKGCLVDSLIKWGTEFLIGENCFIFKRQEFLGEII